MVFQECFYSFFLLVCKITAFSVSEIIQNLTLHPRDKERQSKIIAKDKPCLLQFNTFFGKWFYCFSFFCYAKFCPPFVPRKYSSNICILIYSILYDRNIVCVGKDSLAALLWVREHITTNFTTVFCDTGWEHPLTYEYINRIADRLNLDLVTLKSPKYDGMVGLAKQKKRWPSTRARFCTQELKTKPCIDYVLDNVQDNMLMIQGIRAAESPNRAAMSKQCTYFKYYFEPYGYDKAGKPKMHTYRGHDVRVFRKQYADDLLRPVFDWSAQQVIDYILSAGLEPNPLYTMGYKRVGCWPCVMASQRDILNISRQSPDRIEQIATLEHDLKSSFFGPDKIPAHAITSGEKYPTINDVVQYVKWQNATGSLFDDDTATSCMSFYGLCE